MIRLAEIEIIYFIQKVDQLLVNILLIDLNVRYRTERNCRSLMMSTVHSKDHLRLISPNGNKINCAKTTAGRGHVKICDRYLKGNASAQMNLCANSRSPIRGPCCCAFAHCASIGPALHLHRAIFPICFLLFVFFYPFRKILIRYGVSLRNSTNFLVTVVN